MFALPGILTLLGFIYLRPQEFSPLLHGVPWLHLGLALAILGIAADVRLRKSRPELTALDGAALAFGAWCVLDQALVAPSSLGDTLTTLGIDVALYLVIARGVQTLAALRLVAGVLLALVLALSAIGVHQHEAPLGCHRILEAREEIRLAYDGRACEVALDCRRGDGEPDAEYLCEHVGLFGTSSVGGRVRYRGKLGDPNDLSLALGAALPLAFALGARRRRFSRRALAVIALGLVGTCIVLTQSRGGQLVFATVLAVYCVHRYGVRGLVLAALAALPVLLFGGRSGAEAAASTDDRVDAWWAGLEMIRTWPILGVGQAQFVEHNYLTAHNAYVLTGAELGLPGLGLFSVAAWLGLKGPLLAMRRLSHEPGVAAAEARAFALAVAASVAGLLVGIFFLSYAYHPVLWVSLGLSGALSSVMRTHDESWSVRVGLADLAGVALADVLVLAGVHVYTRLSV